MKVLTILALLWIWSAPEDGGPVDTYEVQVQQADTTLVLLSPETAVVTDDTYQRIRVRGWNHQGAGPWSLWSDWATPPTSVATKVDSVLAHYHVYFVEKYLSRQPLDINDLTAWTQTRHAINRILESGR